MHTRDTSARDSRCAPNCLHAPKTSDGDPDEVCRALNGFLDAADTGPVDAAWSDLSMDAPGAPGLGKKR
jgi:hypothetical protein